MRSLLLAIGFLATAAAQASPESCPDLRKAFAEYRLAVLQGTEVGRHFSHRYLAGQVDDLLVNGDDATILHNVKATRKQILIAPVARSDYQIAARCSASDGSIALTFPTGSTRLLRLSYVLESGLWRIDSLEISFGRAAADGT